MTKVKKWWLKMSNWNKLRSALTALVALVEGALFAGNIDTVWRWFTLCAGVLIILITHLIEDANNNNIPDIFEDDSEERSNHIDPGL